MSHNNTMKKEIFDDTSLWPKEPIVTLPPPFVDGRGEIQSLVEMPMQSSHIIRSNPGAIRGNHYHKTDWHFDYIISGECEFYFRPVGDTNPPKMMMLKSGQMLWTPPMVEHAMRYPVECLMVSFARNPRTHDAYESDVVRVKLI